MYSVAAAVSNSAKPSVVVMMRCASPLAGPKVLSAHSDSSAAGMLPAHSWPTTRQGTRRWRAMLTVPPILVNAANSRSVPMARWGFTPKKKIRIGVISEPPPTPVRPTISPTAKPAKINANSCMAANVGGVLMDANYCFVLLIC
ncbi:hypothetical protein D3C71_1694580 [compost metagenome]